MDRYEYTVKAEKIKQLADQKDYATAARIASSVDWTRVQDTRTLMMVAEVYENDEQYEEAKSILLTAYDLAPVGKNMLCRLTEICIKQRKLSEAENYFSEFVNVAPRDVKRYILRYELACARKEPLDRRIAILEDYHARELDEKWALELAELYHRADRGHDCVQMCDDIILWFGEGTYVDAARELKQQYSNAVAEDRRKKEEENENRRKRIEELEAAVGADAVADTMSFFRGGRPSVQEEVSYDAELDDSNTSADEGYSDEYEEYDEEEFMIPQPEGPSNNIWADPHTAEMTVGQMLGEDDSEDGLYETYLHDLSDSGYNGGYDDEDYADFGGGYAEDAYEEEYYDEEEPLYAGDFAPEQAEPERKSRIIPLHGVNLADLLSAGSSGDGLDVETFSWLDGSQTGATNEGTRIWGDIAKADKDALYRPESRQGVHTTFDDEWESGAFGSNTTYTGGYVGEYSDDGYDDYYDEEHVSVQTDVAYDEYDEYDDYQEYEPYEYEEDDFGAELTSALEMSAVDFTPAGPIADLKPVEPARASRELMAEAANEGYFVPKKIGVLKPMHDARQIPRKMYDDQGFLLSEDLIPEDLNATKKLDLPWAHTDDATKKLDDLKGIHEAITAPREAEQDAWNANVFVNPDAAADDASDYIDIEAVREETEARRARAIWEIDARKTDNLWGGEKPEYNFSCILVEVSEEENAVHRALEMIHDAHAAMGVEEVQTAKVTGTKLNSRGMTACLNKLAGRDLIVQEAGDLENGLITELMEAIKNPSVNGVVILTDTPDRLRRLVAANPELIEMSVYEEVDGQTTLSFMGIIEPAPEEEPAEPVKSEFDFDYEPTPAHEPTPEELVNLSVILPDIHGVLVDEETAQMIADAEDVLPEADPDVELEPEIEGEAGIEAEPGIEVEPEIPAEEQAQEEEIDEADFYGDLESNFDELEDEADVDEYIDEIGNNFPEFENYDEEDMLGGSAAEEVLPESEEESPAYGGAFAEAVLGDAPEQSLDEEMAMAFGDLFTSDAEPANAEPGSNSAEFTSALAAELARMLDDDSSNAQKFEDELPSSEGLYIAPENFDATPAYDTDAAGVRDAADVDEYIEGIGNNFAEFESYDEEDMMGGAAAAEDVEPTSYDDDYANDGDIVPEDTFGYADDDPETMFDGVRAFAAYAEQYAESLDCILDDKAGLAIYECAEDALSDGMVLSVGLARELIEDAVEMAERRSVRSVFKKKYDKQGRLILREENFQ